MGAVETVTGITGIVVVAGDEEVVEGDSCCFRSCRKRNSPGGTSTSFMASRTNEPTLSSAGLLGEEEEEG